MVFHVRLLMRNIALRIGDAVAAREIFQSDSAGIENDDTKIAIESVLSYLVQRQGSFPSVWDTPGPLVFPSYSSRSISEACERAKTVEHLDFHRIGSLSLLGGASELPTADSIAGFSTIEDYLFGLLWRAIQNPEPVSELEKIGETILGFGAGYFRNQDSGGWSYSVPLMVVQQFRTALSYLVQEGGATGLLQATHLGMFLSSSGIPLENLGETKSQPSDSFITSLLVEYATWLHAAPCGGPISALDYLAWIPNRSMLMKEVRFYAVVRYGREG